LGKEVSMFVPKMSCSSGERSSRGKRHRSNTHLEKKKRRNRGTGRNEKGDIADAQIPKKRRQEKGTSSQKKPPKKSKEKTKKVRRSRLAWAGQKRGRKNSN